MARGLSQFYKIDLNLNISQDQNQGNLNECMKFYTLVQRLIEDPNNRAFPKTPVWEQAQALSLIPEFSPYLG
jgi:hypothetical protein